jgi:hypothetical protein
MNTTVHQSFYASFISSNPNTPLVLTSSPPLTRQPVPRRTGLTRTNPATLWNPCSSPLSFSIFVLNLVILRSEICHELTRKSTNLASPPPRFETSSTRRYRKQRETRVLLQCTVFKLESVRHPRITFLSIGNLLSTTKRTVKIIDSS